MANSTDPFAQQVHGTNPQYLIEKITRNKIYNSRYWKEECFGLTASTILEKACALKYIGGNYGGNLKPSKFLCLLLKLLQLQPEREIVYALLEDEDFKYVRLLGAFYLRMVGKAEEVFVYVEPLLRDYRPVAYRTVTGWEVRHVDEMADALLHEELVCDVAVPHLTKRLKLEEAGVLQPRQSALEGELREMERLEQLAADPSRLTTSSSGEDEAKVDVGKEDEAVIEQKDEGPSTVARQDSLSEENAGKRTIAVEKEMKDREKDDDDRRRPEANKRSRSESTDSGGHDRRREERHRDRDRDRDSREPSRRRYRHRDSSHSRDRDRDRDRRRVRDSRDRHHDRGSDRDRGERISRERRQDRNRDQDHRHHRRRSPSRSSEDTDEKHRQRRGDSRDRRHPRRHSDDDCHDQHKRKDKSALENEKDCELEAVTLKTSEKQQKNEKLFDKMFGKKKTVSNTTTSSSAATRAPPERTGGKVMFNQKGEKVIITASEGSVEYWNQVRECLGMSKLK
jgi:pre-mRNA-splicing factor 38A